MKLAEYNRVFRLMCDNARYTAQDTEAYNATGDTLYLNMIIEESQKVIEYAKMLQNMESEDLKRKRKCDTE